MRSYSDWATTNKWQHRHCVVLWQYCRGLLWGIPTRSWAEPVRVTCESNPSFIPPVCVTTHTRALNMLPCVFNVVINATAIMLQNNIYKIVLMLWNNVQIPDSLSQLKFINLGIFANHPPMVKVILFASLIALYSTDCLQRIIQVLFSVAH